MANGRIDENGLPVYAPGDYDYVRVVDRSTGASRNALAPEVTAAARVLADELGGLVQEAERVANAAINTVETTSSNILAGLEGSIDSMVADAQAEIDAALAGLGYFPPVPFTSGIVVDSGRVTVEHGGNVYAPVISEIPFTTTGTFNPSQWRMLQGVTSADLADPNGAALIGYGNTSVFAALNRLALPETNLLAGLTGISYGDVARVVNQRDGGYWKWRSGDVSALVGSDPYGALWRAPASAPSGAAGAWERVVENGVFDAEWVLPDAMPSNAQVRLNAMIDALPASARRFILPNRRITTTGSIRLTKGITYEGHSHDGRIDGQGGQFFAVIAQASNALLRGIKAGNVAGQVGLGEPGGFHVNDGATSNNSPTIQQISNVGLEACETYDAECGLRFGYSSRFGYPDPGSEVAASKDCWASDFRASGIERIGIEYFWAYDVEVRNPRIRMKAPATISGFDRLMRLANARKITIIGGCGKGPVNGSGVPEGNCHGISCENADNVVVEGTRLENFLTYIRADQSENVTVSGVQGVGWSDTRDEDFFTSVDRDGAINRNFKIIGCTATNIGVFARLHGPLHGSTIENNTHIDNEANFRHFLINNSNGVAKGLVVRGNRYISSGPSRGGQAVRLASWDAGNDITMDDNEFSGSTFAADGGGIVRTKGPGSNRDIGTDLWATVRPPVTKGDFDG